MDMFKTVTGKSDVIGIFLTRPSKSDLMGTLPTRVGISGDGVEHIYCDFKHNYRTGK